MGLIPKTGERILREFFFRKVELCFNAQNGLGLIFIDPTPSIKDSTNYNDEKGFKEAKSK